MPNCPSVVVRTARRGPNAGGRFYGSLTISSFRRQTLPSAEDGEPPAPTPFEPAVVSTKERIFPKLLPQVVFTTTRFAFSKALQSHLFCWSVQSPKTKQMILAVKQVSKLSQAPLGLLLQQASGLRFCLYRSHPARILRQHWHPLWRKSSASLSPVQTFRPRKKSGPNPVDTYRPEDIEKLGVRNATDLLTKLPQEMGSTVNQNIVRWRRWQRHTEPARFAAERNSGSHRWKTRCHNWDWRCFQWRPTSRAWTSISFPSR